MTVTSTFYKQLRLAGAATMMAAVLTPLHAQMSAGPGTMAKPTTAAASGTMGQDKMPMGHGGDMKSKMDHMQSQMTAMKSTGNPDVDFAMMMRVHHQGAITMAEAQLKDGKDPKMIKMAKSIIADQKKEIAVFDKFLADKGQPGMTMAK